MKVFSKPTREPLPADHGARCVAHYLSLALFLAVLAVAAAAPGQAPVSPSPDPVKDAPLALPALLTGVLELAREAL